MQEKVPDSAGHYVSVPTIVEAIQWTGDNIHALWDWAGADNVYGPIPPEDRRAPTPARLYVAANNAWLELEIGEWILKDDLGFYPCKDAIFRKKYTPNDGSGILVIPPGLLQQIRDAFYEIESIRSKQTTVSTEHRLDPWTNREQTVVTVDHTVEITAERKRG